jgi:hypothetical protein
MLRLRGVVALAEWREAARRAARRAASLSTAASEGGAASFETLLLVMAEPMNRRMSRVFVGAAITLTALSAATFAQSVLREDTMMESVDPKVAENIRKTEQLSAGGAMALSAALLGAYLFLVRRERRRLLGELTLLGGDGVLVRSWAPVGPKSALEWRVPLERVWVVGEAPAQLARAEEGRGLGIERLSVWIQPEQPQGQGVTLSGRFKTRYGAATVPDTERLRAWIRDRSLWVYDAEDRVWVNRVNGERRS